MKTLIALTVTLLTAIPAAAQDAWKSYNKGVTWEDSLEAAKVRASKENKPILFHQLVGDMTLEGC